MSTTPSPFPMPPTPPPPVAPTVDVDGVPAARRELAGRRLDLAWGLLPGALVVFFTFQAGGFFPDSVGFAAVGLAVALALRVTLSSNPFASLTPALGVASAALAGYAAWVLLSESWSHAPGRAVTEFSRALLYLLALLTCATLPQRTGRRRLALYGLATALFVGCSVGITTRLVPGLLAPSIGAVPTRLSDPLTYWNSMGLFAALGLLLVLGLASAEREPLRVRALAAAASPLMAMTLFLTFSRGALLATAVGLLALLVAHRSRGLVTGLLATLPPIVLAIFFVYRVAGLATERPPLVPETQRLGVLLGLVLCMAVAAWLRVLVDRRLASRISAGLDRVSIAKATKARAAITAVAAVVILAVALGVPSQVQRQFDRFKAGTATTETDQRQRILNPANNGRLDPWRVAIDVWREHPVTGTGAGTFQVNWSQGRRIDLDMRDAHSLYLETLADLGLVGFGLLLVALGALAFGAINAARKRNAPGQGGDRGLEAAVAAMLAAWFVQAGLDWMWETPAVTVWVFALGGLLLAGPVPRGLAPGPGRTPRVAIALGCLALAVVPFSVARSQRELRAANEAFAAKPQNCPETINRALASLNAIGGRAEPWELIAYCDVGEDELGLATQAAASAVQRDPENWVFHYAQALVLAAAGEDPRPSARAAERLNPRNPVTGEAVKAFADAPKRTWSAVARRLPLPQG